MRLNELSDILVAKKLIEKAWYDWRYHGKQYYYIRKIKNVQILTVPGSTTHNLSIFGHSTTEF